ncbi:LacI family DNA-binding transcriptional regulator [Brachybacterium paraconglomeratum]|uniref:LacI family DNA-binding transcriptional regulator n=1 Tax=Brachybacterium paraconglomeratum TaxID=173362 RepID=UPI003513D792
MAATTPDPAADRADAPGPRGGTAARRRPTMRDVAQEAGVSTALVSIVFREAPGASDETRQRVREAAANIGYVVDERARLLRRRRSPDVGVLFQTGQPFHQQLLEDLYAEIEGAGGAVILSGASPHRDERTALASLVSYRCGAIIVLGADLPEEELLRGADGIALVSVARPAGPGIDWVASDDERATALALEHLAALGHERVLFASAPGAAGAPQREQGLHEAAARLGVQVEVAAGGTTEVAGAALAEQLLSRDALPDAVITFNDRAALGFLDVLVRCGVRVPEDLSVIGNDDSEIAARSYVDLTTIAQDTRRLAAEAARLARCRMRGVDGAAEADGVPAGTPSSDGAAVDGKGAGRVAGGGVVVPVELVVRSSTGPVAARG